MGLELGEVINERIRDLGLSPQRIAKKAGLSTDYVYKIIHGERNPEEETVLKLADVLELDRKDLLFTACRDSAPEEAKHYFRKEPFGTVRWIPSWAMPFGTKTPLPVNVEEDQFSKAFIEIVKRTRPKARQAIEQHKDFEDQYREAEEQFSSFQIQGEKREVEKFRKEIDQLNKNYEAYQKQVRQKKPSGFELPLLTEEMSENPRVLFKSENKETKTWKFALEKTSAAIPFAYRMADEAMISFIQPKDLVICFAGEGKSEQLSGKVVIAKIRRKGIVVRFFIHEPKRAVFTALNPSFPPHILSHGEIEWLYPVKGIYREL